ncbi:TPR repeat protein [Trichormus variabilis ATCC 29413]|uniref:TPR repeat protein n=2 Tax=Anabaena variabilis TaxID=264691 RepID=Q3M365_TRIV2|nr:MULTISPECIES: tetratricopeptide repeat protein [Nostocaceae]ABA24571.1 TPR repeat protein [Trichormus variabilis ATCC 29413]MBC1215844.1 tetratricopeptide repeat protein [Trichormus variabilis ARAD]MBC1256056.1 tetratricopeptide repeat protein [Trichormus variabilis V5]MBC1269409.1 tetratricopeptide repeat protein [Trichormus variabilis FSR]MBC1304463.1 tetratricopeptide repeat protein [Trichormus variabilis N2B]
MNNEFYNQGLEKAKQRDYAGAIEEFSRALKLTPYFAEAYLQRGLAYYDSGAILLAVSDYTEVIRINPESVEAYYCRSLARLALKNLPGALEDVEQAIRLNINYAAAHHLRGTVRRKQGYIQDAIASFKQAAELYLQQKDQENCRLCLEKIKQLQPPKQSTIQPTKSPIAPITSVNEYFTQLLDKAEQGDTREAIADLNWILQADPQDAQAYCCRGVVRCKMGNYREAIADFNQALQLNFQDAVVYRNRGKARSLLGDHRGAIADFNQAIQIQPEDTLGYVARGNTYRAMGNYLGAIQDYGKALQINPHDAQAYYNRGIAYTFLEEMQNAVEDYQRAASIFCEQQDWENYQLTQDSLKQIQTSIPEYKQQKSNVLRQKLLRLVGGYWEIAQRLIQQQKDYQPGMSEEWYMQKVIDDLERDRGR